MRFVGLITLAVIAACGGTTGTPDDGGLDGTASDTGADGTTGDAANDGAPNDSGNKGDVVQVDAGECVPPDTACAVTCPQGTICLKASGPTEHDLGCTNIPAACNGVGTCTCMADCFCPPNGINKCMAGQGFLECSNGTVSRREFKKDISYIDEGERQALAEQALQTRLAQYRYKADSPETQRHLGFIIDDMPNASPAVQADKTHVDLYGYTTMLLAAVQEQQKQIDDLKTQLDALKK